MAIGAGPGYGRALTVDIVSLDDFLHQRMPYHVRMREVDELDALNLGEHPFGVTKPAARPAWEIDLGYVAGDNRLGTNAQTCQKHLHLSNSRILRFVENHETVVQRTTAHKR